MKKCILLNFLLINFFVFSQGNCKYSVTINADKLKETGKFELSIKNGGTKSFNIPKEINFCNMYLVDLEFFNEKMSRFEKMKMSAKDIDCFSYHSKQKKLKPNTTYNYLVDIKNDFEIMQHDSFFDTFNNLKYRFKLNFSLDSYNNCGESNNLTTDWIYKN